MSPVKVREIIFPSVSFEGSPPIRKCLANEKATDDYHYEKFRKMKRQEIIFPSLSFEGSPPNRKRPLNEKATDDYHYEKFKKMNRRY